MEALSLIDPTFAHASIDRLVGDLSLHERQLVEIARALDSGASLQLLTNRLPISQRARPSSCSPCFGD